MRKKSPLDSLFPKTRQAILATTILNPDYWWYLSDLARQLKLTPSSLQRELNSLVDAGILQRRQDGKRVYFKPDTDCPFLQELQSIMTKTVGLRDVLCRALKPLAKSIRCAFIYGSWARGEANSQSDIDLMVIGAVGLSNIAPLLRKCEGRLNRPINPTVYSLKEFQNKLKSGNHFLTSTVREKKLFIIGDKNGLETASGQ